MKEPGEKGEGRRIAVRRSIRPPSETSIRFPRFSRIIKNKINELKIAVDNKHKQTLRWWRFKEEEYTYGSG